MKKRLIPLICAAMISSGSIAASAFAENIQAKWVADVPIMPALMVEKGLGFAFDNPDGRIVTIYLSGDISKEKVSSYYDQALEPLGWTQVGNSKWIRDAEILKLTTTTAAGVSLWKITLRPE